jgi:hypothetical protein
MPISIAGSGTITGISVGGIPDDCITTAEIAANAVTYAKIGTTEQGQLCKAWVNFNGVGTVAIRASYNVSSITDNGTGDYTVNFTTAMPDVNYCAVTGVGAINVTAEFQSQCNVNGPYSTTSIRLATGFIANTSEAQQDKSVIQIAIFR